MRKVFLIFGAAAVFSCSQSPKKNQRMQWTGGAFVTGAILGAATAPKDEKPEVHAMYWGSMLGLATAIAAQYYIHDEDNYHKLKDENEQLKNELDLIQNAKQSLIDQGQGQFKNPTDDPNRKGQRAQWKVYEINKWIKDGPNRLIHQDKLVEIVPENSDKKNP